MTLREKTFLYLDLIRWDRPAGWLLLLWPTLSALWVAAQGFPGWHLLLVFVCGTILMRSAGCCINDVADKDFDRFVERTQARPLTVGRVSVTEALWLGAALAVAAFLLVLSTNAETIVLSFFALAITVIYPFSKRFFAMPQAFLGVAFSVGIPMAFTAVQAEIPVLAYLLLCANFFWVLAYDTEYAMVDREDDLKIGIKTMAITLGQYDVVGVIVFYLAWLGLSLWAAIASAVGVIFYLGWGLSLLQVLWHWRLIKARTRPDCFTAFRANHWAGLTLFCGWVLGFI